MMSKLQRYRYDIVTWDDKVTVMSHSWAQRTHHYNDVMMSTMATMANHQPHDCLLNRLFKRRSKKTSKFRVTGLCEGSSPETGEFPAQRASNAEKVSIWWRHHDSGYDICVNKTPWLAGTKTGISCLNYRSITQFCWSFFSVINRHYTCIDHFDGVAQYCSISIGNALEILQSCTKSSISSAFVIFVYWVSGMSLFGVNEVNLI